MKPTVTYPLPTPRSDKGRYRYFFNGQEGDAEVYGQGGLHAFEYRMHDTRIGRLWSVDPLAGKFPWNSTYAFAENSPIGFMELEGLEKLLAITMGEDVKYRSAFLKATDDNIETFHIQKSVETLGKLTAFLMKSTSQDENGIGFLAIFSHGTPNNIFAQGDFSNGISSSDLDVIATLVETDKIKFYKNAIIYLGGCNVGTEGDIINPSTHKSEYVVFAQKLADITGAIVVAANDQVIPKKNVKEKDFMTYSTARSSKTSFWMFQKGQDPISLGCEVSVIDLLKQVENSILNEKSEEKSEENKEEQ
jgi:RHS repeat-associated protein